MLIPTSLSPQNDASSSDNAAALEDESDGEFGIILVSQGSFASSLHEGIEHMLGPQTNIIAIPLSCDESLESAISRMHVAINEVDSAKGIIILADIFGGTPCNAAMKFYKKGEIEVIAGVNLPFVVKLAKMRAKKPLHVALEEAHNAGHRYLISCGDHIGYTLS